MRQFLSTLLMLVGLTAHSQVYPIYTDRTNFYPSGLTFNGTFVGAGSALTGTLTNPISTSGNVEASIFIGTKLSYGDTDFSWQSGVPGEFWKSDNGLVASWFAGDGAGISNVVAVAGPLGAFGSAAYANTTLFDAAGSSVAATNLAALQAMGLATKTDATNAASAAVAGLSAGASPLGAYLGDRWISGAFSDGSGATPIKFVDTPGVVASSQSTAIGASITNVPHTLFYTTTTSGDKNGIHTTVSGMWCTNNNEFSTTIALTNATAIRCWFGLNSVPNAASWSTDDLPETASRQGALFRFSTAAGDTTLKCITSNGSASTVVDSGYTPTAERWLKLRIKFTGATSVTFYTNGVACATISDHLPTACAIGPTDRIATLETVAKGLRWQRYWCSAD